MSRHGQIIGIFAVLIILVGSGLWLVRRSNGSFDRTGNVLDWLNDPQDHPEWAVHGGEKCASAPFLIPTGGLIGYLWDDSFRLNHRHQGIDIFGGSDVNTTPVYAAYPGFVTRLEDWKSSLIIRVPQDPLLPGRQIWIYYTHMAGPDGASYISDDFPPGARDIPVDAGTLLGYQGNYSGATGNPVGVHLHFSIVLDDGSGHFLNELEIQNTLDPSPYLGLPLNGKQNTGQIPVCNSSE